ncbi:hypothetical protein QYE76_020382 [Lolium multiflorum]|uniref:Uncharacterized protein n=1 Tax=Lolium multiflorum TaxID=4521 RepID=A0AAD8R4Q3_LOLMU|nr:hypothetical protein QYE76_020382 [Lolium multiflorum]
MARRATLPEVAGTRATTWKLPDSLLELLDSLLEPQASPGEQVATDELNDAKLSWVRSCLALHQVLSTRAALQRPHRSLPAEITAALRDLTAVQEIRLFWRSRAAAGRCRGSRLCSRIGLASQPRLSVISESGHTSAGGPSSPRRLLPTGTLQQRQRRRHQRHRLLSSDPSFGGQATAAALLPSPPTPQQRLLPPPTPSLPFGDVGATLAPGSTSTPPGMPFHQVCFPPSPSPLPAWIAIRHVSAAVRLQAAARGLLVRRRVREMRDLQLQLLQVALHCATDLDLVRCVVDLGRTVSPTGGGHAVFPAGSDLKVCAIDSHSAGEGMVSPTGAHRVAPPHSAAGRRAAPFVPLVSMGSRWLYRCTSDKRTVSTLCSGVNNKAS